MDWIWPCRRGNTKSILLISGQCLKGCKPHNQCTEAESGLFVEVRFFQLHELDIPGELNQRFLQSLILKEATFSEKLRQDALIIRKETDALVSIPHLPPFIFYGKVGLILGITLVFSVVSWF